MGAALGAGEADCDATGDALADAVDAELAVELDRCGDAVDSLEPQAARSTMDRRAVAA